MDVFILQFEVYFFIYFEQSKTSIGSQKRKLEASNFIYFCPCLSCIGVTTGPFIGLAGPSGIRVRVKHGDTRQGVLEVSLRTTQGPGASLEPMSD